MGKLRALDRSDVQPASACRGLETNGPGSPGIGDRMEEFQSIWTKANGLKLHAVASTGRVAVQKTPMVLVHGLGLSHRYMMPVAKCLARDFRVYAPDLPGFGLSEHPPQVLDVSGLADGLLAWMDSVELERAALLGNSFGCQIIADFAAKYPERTFATVLQGPTTPPGERSWFWQFIRWRQNSPYNPPEMDPCTWPEYRMSGYLRVLRTFQYSIKDPVEEKLPKVAAPTLVVRGESDPICHKWWAEQVCSLVQDGRLELIPDVAHTLVFTAPKQLSRVSRSFLDEMQPASTD